MIGPLRHRGFRRLVSGQLASNLGDAFYAVALPWYVLATHGGALRLGEVLAAYGIARAAALVVGGSVSDRLAPWTAMMGSDAVRTVVLAALAAVAATGPARLVLLLPIAAVAGAGEGIFLPGSFAIVPALLPDDDLQAGNALTSGATQVATLVGPALGGLVVALAGPATGFAIDAATFLVSALTLSGIRRTGSRAAPGGSDERTLRRVIRDEPVLAIIFVVIVAANLGSGGVSEVALPALAHGPFAAGADGYGALVASFAAGALIGTVVAARVGRVRRPMVVATVAFVAEAAFEAVVPYLGGTIPAAAALVGYGALNGFANVLTITVLQRWAPRALIGRVMGFVMLGAFGIFPVSVLLAGAIVHADGPAIFFPIAAALLVLALMGALTRRAWREFGAEPAAA